MEYDMEYHVKYNMHIYIYIWTNVYIHLRDIIHVCIYIYRCGTLEMYNDVGDSLCHFGLGYKIYIPKKYIFDLMARWWFSDELFFGGIYQRLDI